MKQTDQIKFILQDEVHTVKLSDVTPETTLNQYLRQNAKLMGTKNMCFEGGCGACIVAVTLKDPVTQKDVTMAVNSCLVSIFSCHGWKITTIEGLGDPLSGFHKIQKVLAQFNGTQCGFCSPGMVMNMYALSEGKKLTMKEVENSFGGNICRCTGYRSILSAFKSLCTDADPKLLGSFPDIEDVKICPKSKKECTGTCKVPSNEPLHFQLGASKWIKLFTIKDLLEVFTTSPNSTYMLVAGNTAQGVYRKTETKDMYIDVNDVKELKGHQIQNNNLIIGANTSLTDTMELFYNTAKENKNFSYLKLMGDHIDLIANVPVRNAGTLAGNLMIKHEHNEFPSDIFVILATIEASLTIVGTDNKEVTKTVEDFLKYDMKQKVIKNIILPARDESFKYDSFKIMIRAQNAHALVNAGFLVQLDNKQVVQSARIVYGCINPSFIRAANTEKYLIGKSLFNNTTLQGAFTTLSSELKPDHVLPDPSPEFRKGLAISLFYKFILSITPDNIISPRNKSGAKKLERPVTSETHDYGTIQSLYPLTEPVPKIEALAQTSGQAEYVFDMPDSPHQLFAAFVLAKAPPYSQITKIDPSEALKINGVVAFFDKDDIPGENNFMFPNAKEEIFCSGTVQHYFQPVGLIVANSQYLATKAADLVKITFIPGKTKAHFSIEQILKDNATDKIKKQQSLTPKSKGTDIKHVVKGTFNIGWQYHYQMETQTCNIIPTEDGFDMYPSTQWMDLAQNAAAQALNLPAHKFNVTVRRLGGAYGSKISRNSLISTAAAIAAYKLNKPIKLRMPFEQNMNVIGKRFPCYLDYEVGVNDKGVIQYMEAKQYTDLGVGNESAMSSIVPMFTVNYNTDTWKVDFHTARTDCHANTYCRSPGTTEGLAMIESVMEHIAYKLKLDPLEVRLNNLKKDNVKIPEYVAQFKTWADVDNRRAAIKNFNKENRWVKKGLAVVPMTYQFYIFGNYPVIVSIYKHDGTVAIAHGGIEMGQGVNTKAAQVCAHKFGITLDKISVKPSNNLIGANSMVSGGSITSEAVCFGVLTACDTLNKLMEPYKEENQTWQQLVAKCYQNNVDLRATAMYSNKSPNIKNYDIYGVCGAEVEVDLLTGQHIVRRVDLLEDTGDSMSPLIDIGQVEGAVVMAQGYFTTEEIVFDEQGQLLTNRTWNYKPPGAKDIPVDFRMKFPKNNPNPVGVLNSKATAEPPLCMSCSLPLAIRNALVSAREEADSTKESWYPFDGASTVENTFMNSLHDIKQYVL